jgi:ParB-like chromosome segregation protein Spo0J
VQQQELQDRGQEVCVLMSELQLFDALSPHIEDALRASIHRFGVLVPVVRDQHGNTIDGHHRSRLADELGVKYRVDVVSVVDKDEAREIARHLNSRRRHLSGDQLREHIVMLAQRATPSGVGELSQNEIAKVVGVDQSHVNRVLNDPELMTTHKLPDTRRGADGKVRPAKRPTIVAARNEREAERAQEALSSLGEQAPARVLDVKRAERMAREKVAEERRAQPIEAVTVASDIDIRHGDFRTVLADIEPGTADAIITDPPYPREFVSLFEDLSALAARVLAPNGVLAVMTGQSHLPAYIDLLGKHMRYRWCGAYIVQGPRNRVHAARVGTGWKPILIYSQHEANELPFILDDLFDSAGDDKRFHHWGQSESGIAALVERLTRPGALICDPFLGGGTTAVVAKDLDRRFIGCDLDAGHVATSRERVA